ncbi:DUF1971 domain-containing protein [Cognatishimia sp.]|uniref:DUF1971 domain-containing protein n=1 Tax=Cognatishimia sp. TaxID=2211648 RepID=UPI003512A364|nr:DUF1971 domain-containing protein [Cognatishimia sp.]
MTDFPQTLTKYSESPEFTQDTIPLALRRDHYTKDGVWGKIVVTEGELLYLREDLPAQVVTATKPATIFPTEPHSVSPRGNVRFKVEFYRDDAEGSLQ